MNYHLVTVVVPCFNAERTLARTLDSVIRQTHRNIEILIVDDGSTDSTAEIARAFACRDRRLRVLVQANRGIAAARNCGLAEARGEFFAPIDADDLWQPDKLELQLQKFASDRSVSLVYSWFENIDEDDGVFSGGFRYSFEGEVLEPLCRVDFIGNGSNAIMRTALVREIGGYDPSLRASDAEGCEDWKLALQLAERSRFAVVQKSLTGYRHSRGNISSNVARMVKSAERVASEVAERHPQYGPVLRRHILNRVSRGLIRSVRECRSEDVRYLAARLMNFGTTEVISTWSEIIWRSANSAKKLPRLATSGARRRVARRKFLARQLC